MAEFAAGLASGIIATLLVVVVYAAVVVGGRADDQAEALTELETLRKQLATCRQMAQAQRERADYYYDLFCTGAKANAALRNGRAR